MTVLEHLRSETGVARCLYFRLMDRPPVPGLREMVIAAARRHVASVDTSIYLCEDGDVFILAPVIPAKDGRLCMHEIVGHIGELSSGQLAFFFEAPLQVNTLIMLVEQKLEKRRREQETLRKQLEQQQAERKRQAILNVAPTNKAGDIAQRRNGRGTPRLMMIEDDHFSRKLVENVLQKKYALTALGTAEHALETYVNTAPDLLFLDINLPDVTGHELLEKIMALDPDAYVIMLSGNADRENILQAMNCGAKGFVAKPFTRDKLLQTIERCPGIMLRNAG